MENKPIGTELKVKPEQVDWQKGKKKPYNLGLTVGESAITIMATSSGDKFKLKANIVVGFPDSFEIHIG